MGFLRSVILGVFIVAFPAFTFFRVIVDMIGRMEIIEKRWPGAWGVSYQSSHELETPNFSLCARRRRQ